MKLKKFLSENKERIVALGAKSSFMCFCKAENKKEIEDNFEAYRSNQCELNKKSKTMLQMVAPLIPADEEEFRKNARMLIDTLKPLILNLEESLSRYEKDLNKKEKASREYLSSKEYIDGYIPVLEREVEECYDRETDDAIAVIVDGLEDGKFWSKKEYDEWRKKSEKNRKIYM